MLAYGSCVHYAVSLPCWKLGLSRFEGDEGAKHPGVWRIFVAWYMEVRSMEEEDTRDYEVLVNGEEQYSLWLAGQQIPNGWRQVGPRGKKQVCLDYVKEVWTDMRPLSVRKAMEAHAKAQQEAREREQAAAAPPPPAQNGESGSTTAA
jgi:MbtH protein